MVQSTIVFVNTRNIVPLEQTNQNNVIVNLDEPIFVPEDHDCMLSVNQAQIPNSFYSFNEPLTFNVRWNGLTKTISATRAADNTIVVDSVTNLFIGQVMTLTGTAFGGLQTNTPYVITAIDAGNNRIQLRDFTAQPTIVASVGGANMGVVSVNHIARTITLFNGANISVGDRIRFVNGWGTALLNNVDYWVVSKNVNVIEISDAPTGVARFPSSLPSGITMSVVAGPSKQVISVNPTNDTIVLSDVNGLTALVSQVSFDQNFCGITTGTNFVVRSINTGTNEIQLNFTGTQFDILPSTPLAQGTIVQQQTTTGTMTGRLATTQTFTIDTTTSAPTTGMPGGAYTLAMFEGGATATGNALHGKTLAFTNGIASTLTLSCTVEKVSTLSQLTTKPSTVPKITMTFTVSAGTLADFTIERFTNYTLGFDNQTIVGTGTQAISQPMFSPRYVLIGSSLRTPGQVPGGRVRFNPIATIPMQTTFGSVQAYIPPFPSEQKIDDPVIRSFTLQLYDELGNLLNFNGVEWQCALEFKMVPKRKPEYKYSW